MSGGECEGKMVIFSAPSGAGKTTIVKHLINKFGKLEFAISATSRAPRGSERDGVDYFFLSPEQFSQAILQSRFVEWEEVYKGTCYGTMSSELERIWAKGNTILFDVDVKGGLKLKSLFGDRAVSVFIMPPSIAELRKRLVARSTDTLDVIEGRVAKAEQEIEYSKLFDVVVVNDNLEQALACAEQIVEKVLK